MSGISAKFRAYSDFFRNKRERNKRETGYNGRVVSTLAPLGGTVAPRWRHVAPLLPTHQRSRAPCVTSRVRWEVQRAYLLPRSSAFVRGRLSQTVYFRRALQGYEDNMSICCCFVCLCVFLISIKISSDGWKIMVAKITR